jgi:trans-aconitate 2-methyltransferase
MPNWHADQYLVFAQERTQPASDLAAKVILDHPAAIVDLGCGPGNSTEILAARWPGAAIEGIDSAPEMIAAAQAAYPTGRWTLGDIAAWAQKPGPTFDLIFANAALHWVPDHAVLYPALFARLSSGGALAVQVPANLDGPAQTIMREMAESPTWQALYPPDGVRQWHVHSAGFYYDLLAGVASRLELWFTEYIHVLEDAGAIVAWYRGTGLKPYLEALPTEADRHRFLIEYQARIAATYPPQSNGRLLFPFRRLFLVAYR